MLFNSFFFLIKESLFFFVENFAQNPQLIFSLTDPDKEDDNEECSVIISLAQRPLAGGKHNIVERKTEFSIGFRVYKVKIRI